MVKRESEHQDREVQCGVVVVNVGNTGHRNKRNVMQKPANNWVDTRIVDMVDTNLVEVVVSALPSDEVEEDHDDEGAERGSGAPVHHWVSEEEVLDDPVVPAAHAESNMEDGPLPILRCEVILLIRVRDKSIVGGHHRDVQVDKVSEERGLVSADISLRELLVPVRLDVPVCEHVTGVVLLDTSDFDLLETPLWEIYVAGAEIAAETGMFQTECSGESAEPAVIPACGVGHNLNGPVVFVIADGHVTIARHLVVGFGKGSLNRV